MTREWVVIENGDATLSFGHSPNDPQIYITVKAKKDGREATIEWDIEAWYVRDLLNRWFPMAQCAKKDPETATTGQPQK